MARRWAWRLRVSWPLGFCARWRLAAIRRPAERKRAAQQVAAEADTFQVVAEEFLRRSVADCAPSASARLTSRCSTKPLGQLPSPRSSANFVREFDRIADLRGPVRANRVQSATKTTLNWYSARSDYISVLTRTPARISISERSRSHVPSDAELKAIVLAAERDQLFGSYLLFTLLTAARRGESAGLRRNSSPPTAGPGSSRDRATRTAATPLSRYPLPPRRSSQRCRHCRAAITSSAPTASMRWRILPSARRGSTQPAVFAAGDLRSPASSTDIVVPRWRQCRHCRALPGPQPDRRTADLRSARIRSGKRHAFEALVAYGRRGLCAR